MKKPNSRIFPPVHADKNKILNREIIFEMNLVADYVWYSAHRPGKLEVRLTMERAKEIVALLTNEINRRSVNDKTNRA